MAPKMPADWAAFYRTPLILRPDINDFKAYLKLEKKRKKKRKAKEDEAKKFVPTFLPPNQDLPSFHCLEYFDTMLTLEM